MMSDYTMVFFVNEAFCRDYVEINCYVLREGGSSEPITHMGHFPKWLGNRFLKLLNLLLRRPRALVQNKYPTCVVKQAVSYSSAVFLSTLYCPSRERCSTSSLSIDHKGREEIIASYQALESEPKARHT